MHKLTKLGDFLVADVLLPHKTDSKGYELELVVDTGAALTIIDPQVTDYLGYSAREDGIQLSALDGAVGESKGYLVRLPHFKCLGFTMPDFVIACHDMNSKLGVAGLLGMNFLKHFRIDINYNTGRVLGIERITG